MLAIREAQPFEADILTDIAVRSESYWGYDPDFMNNFKLKYKVTEQFIEENPTYVIEKDGRIIGFYGMINHNNETELEYLYVEPEHIGKGIGKLLWDHFVNRCRQDGIERITLVTSPQAVGFYTKQGAVQTGEVESLVRKGRMVPKLVYDIGRDGRSE